MLFDCAVLSALLGEMQCASGEVHLPKSPLRVDPVTGLRNDVSFCAQQPWLQHQSIKDNMCVSHIINVPYGC